MSHQQSEIQQEPLISTTTYTHTTILVMAGFKSLVHQTSKAAVLVLVIALMVQSQSSRAQSQSCSSELSSLNVCAPFVVPGNSANPSTECCGALQGVQHDCLCSTLRIASQLPSRCNIPPTSCDTA